MYMKPLTKRNDMIIKLFNEGYGCSLIVDKLVDAGFEKVSFPNLKPTSRPISIRIPEYLLIRLKERANEINIPYQSLIKDYIKRGILSS